MTAPSGKVTIQVDIDATGLAEHLHAAVSASLAGLSADVAKTMAKIRAEVDQKITARIGVDIDSAKADALQADLRTKFDKDITQKIKIDADAAKAVAEADAAMEGIRAEARKGADFHVHPVVSEEQAQLIHEDLERIFGKDIHQKVEVDVDKDKIDNATNATLGLGGALAGLGKYGGITAGVVAGIAAIGGAVSAALGAVSGLALGLVALGPAVAAGVGTALVAVNGLKDAFKAYKAADASAADDAKTHATEVAAAQKGVVSAQREVRSAIEDVGNAERELKDAQQDAKVAQDDLNRSREEATKNLRDMRLELAGAADKELAAQIAVNEAVRQAQADQFDPAKTADDRVKDQIRIRDAEREVQAVRNKNADLQEKVNKENTGGIDADQKVIASKRAVSKANETVTTDQQKVVDAQAKVVTANSNLADANKALATATDKTSDSQTKLQQALANLSPNMRAFVEAVHDAKPALNDLSNAVQDKAWAGLGQTFSQLAAIYIPLVKDGMGQVADAVNGAIKSWAAFVSTTTGQQAVRSAFVDLATIINAMKPGLLALANGFAGLEASAQPFIKEIGTAFSDMAAGIGTALSELKANGTLNSIMAGFADTLKAVGPFLHDFVTALSILAKDVLPALNPFLTTLGQGLKDLAPAFGQLGGDFARGLTALLPTLSQLISALSSGLRPVLPVLVNLLVTLGQQLIPLVPAFSQFAQIVGNALVDVLKTLGPSLVPLADAFNSLLKAVAPIVHLLGEVLGAAIKALAPVLADLFRALAPVISQFVVQLGPVLAKLAPILSQVALIIGKALIQAIQQIAPVLPPLVTAFANMLLAIAPLLPELAKMSLELLPPLINLLVQLTPTIVLMSQAFVALVNNVLVPVFIPIMEKATDTIRDILQVAGDVVGFFIHGFTDTIHTVGNVIKDLGNIFSDLYDKYIKPAFDGIKSILKDLSDFFHLTVSGIEQVWKDMANALVAPVNFVIHTVYDDGIRKMWNAVHDFLPVLPVAPEIASIPGFQSGGKVSGPGGVDNVLMWGTNDEHMLTVDEVTKAGGHDAVFVMRDMIARQIPFTWDNGRVMTELGQNNIHAFGSAVAALGVGKPITDGFYDPVLKANAPHRLPGYYTGGVIAPGGGKPSVGGILMPWQRQLIAGHAFALAQDGRDYVYGGPKFVGDSFDCSGYMGSIAASILGLNPWQRYFSTPDFTGSTGPLGFVRGLLAPGFTIGVNPEAGELGHTAGVLGAVDMAGYRTARVESGGAIGNVHYGRGTDPTSFESIWGLPIGANGFFDPGVGGAGGRGPSVTAQKSWLDRHIESIVHDLTNPLKHEIGSAIGAPPPSYRGIPAAMVDAVGDGAIKVAEKTVDGLGAGIGAAWSEAQHLAGTVAHAANPLNWFDDGGLATGTGLIAKGVIAPERVLDPTTTGLFEQLVVALTSISQGRGSAGVQPVSQPINPSGVALGTSAKPVVVAFANTPTDSNSSGFTELSRLLGLPDGTVRAPGYQAPAAVNPLTGIDPVTGKLLSDQKSEQDRTQSSTSLAIKTMQDQLNSVLQQVLQQLTDKVLAPTVAAGVTAGFKAIAPNDPTWQSIGNSIGSVVGQALTTTLNNIAAAHPASSGPVLALAGGGTLPGYTPGRDIYSFTTPMGRMDLSGGESIMVPEWTYGVGGPAVVNAMNAAARRAGGRPQSAVAAGLAFADGGTTAGYTTGSVSGAGSIVDPIVSAIDKVTGVTLSIDDHLQIQTDVIRQFKDKLVPEFDTTGKLISDTASLVERTNTNTDAAAHAQQQMIEQIVAGVLKFLITTILIPVISALLSALITLVTTAIGTAIAGPVGAVIGAVVGAALSGLATVVTAAIGAVLTTAVSAALGGFDSGGLAIGTGLMPKYTIEPERVLDPGTTRDFGRLVDILEGGGLVRNTVHAPMSFAGSADGGAAAADSLLSLLNN